MAYRRKRRGMGEYPGYYCYDAARPSWLPYWLDSVAESKCKYTPATIAGNIKACVSGDPSCNPPTPAQQNPDVSGAGVAAPGEPVNVPTCTGLYELDLATNTCKMNFLSTPVLIGAGIFVLGLVAVGGGSPRRYGR
jgi:hypothetical protein